MRKFNAPAAIDAQAHLVSDLLGEFGSVALALAAYDAGPAGELAAPTLEVRLVA